jgi:hypothetical protein
MRVKPEELVRYIAWYATSREMQLTTIRLVKFLYLADLYQARAKHGMTLTGFPWTFVYYGPYCSEAAQAIDLAVSRGWINVDCHESKYENTGDYCLYSCNDSTAERIELQLDADVLYPLKAAIREYGDDTASLLDYVYFGTEPMTGTIRKGARLDFSRAHSFQRPAPPKVKSLSKEQVTAARQHLEAIRRTQDESKKRLVEDDRQSRSLKDDIYFQAMEYFDDEDIQPRLSGTARIVIE